MKARYHFTLLHYSVFKTQIHRQEYASYSTHKKQLRNVSKPRLEGWTNHSRGFSIHHDALPNICLRTRCWHNKNLPANFSTSLANLLAENIVAQRSKRSRQNIVTYAHITVSASYLTTNCLKHLVEQYSFMTFSSITTCSARLIRWWLAYRSRHNTRNMQNTRWTPSATETE